MGAQPAKENDENRISAEFRRTRDRAFCLKCQKPVDLMAYSSAADFFKTDLEDIQGLAETGQLHRIHNRRGEMMICSDSLFTLFDNRQTRPLKSDYPSLKSEDFKDLEGLKLKKRLTED
jgi:hypothetical protein